MAQRTHYHYLQKKRQIELEQLQGSDTAYKILPNFVEYRMRMTIIKDFTQASNSIRKPELINISKNSSEVDMRTQKVDTEEVN